MAKYDINHQYVDGIINSQDQQDPADYATFDMAPEQDTSFVDNLTAYDEEQTKLQEDQDKEDGFNTKLSKLEEMFNSKIDQILKIAGEEDWFSSDEGSAYLEDVYNTQKQSSLYAETPSGAGNTAGALGSKNNYGNLRGLNGQFRNFATPEEGRQALIDQLNMYKTDKSKTGVKSTSTLYEAMAKYAPKGDGKNNPKLYAEYVAKRLGVSPNTIIAKLDSAKWADAISTMENNKNIGR